MVGNLSDKMSFLISLFGKRKIYLIKRARAAKMILTGVASGRK